MNNGAHAAELRRLGEARTQERHGNVGQVEIEKNPRTHEEGACKKLAHVLPWNPSEHFEILDASDRLDSSAHTQHGLELTAARPLWIRARSLCGKLRFQHQRNSREFAGWLLPMSGNPHPPAGTAFPFAWNPDRRDSRRQNPAAGYPYVICSGPAPVPCCPDILTSGRDGLRFNPNLRRGF
jgi:hypothetical protein